MKKIITATLLIALSVNLVGCNSAGEISSVSSESVSSVHSIVEKKFSRPAEVFDIETATSDLSNNVEIDFDEKGRIKECRYTSEDQIKCKAIYTYKDTHAHIFTFKGDNLVDDLVIHCEYSEGAGWIVIKGYYFINTKSTEKETDT